MNQRLLRLEEKSAFIEHAADQLSEQLALACERIDRLVSRLDALERRLAEPDQPAHDPEA